MSIRGEVEKAVDIWEKRSEEITLSAKVIAAAFVAQVVLSIVIVILCGVIASRVKR